MLFFVSILQNNVCWMWSTSHPNFFNVMLQGSNNQLALLLILRSQVMQCNIERWGGGSVDLLRSWAGNVRSQLLYVYCLTWLLCYDHYNMSQATGTCLVSLYYFWSTADDSVLMKHTNLNKECERYSALTVLRKKDDIQNTGKNLNNGICCG